MVVVIKQGKRGRWRWTAYEDVGFGKRVCVAIAPIRGHETREACERAVNALALDEAVREYA